MTDNWVSCTKMDAHSGGRDPPLPPRIFNGGGDAHRVKRDAHPSLPYEHPSPPYVPVTPYEQLKFPRVINPDSPLNDSRQLDWVKPVGPNSQLLPKICFGSPSAHSVKNLTKRDKVGIFRLRGGVGSPVPTSTNHNTTQK